MVVIIVTAYSPRLNTIASVRIEKLAKYLSKDHETFIVAGMPKDFENTSFVKEHIDIGKAYLYEINAKSFRRITNEEKSEKSQGKLQACRRVMRKIKQELSPIAEVLFPVSPGGMLWHKKNEYSRTIQNLIEKYYKTEKIILFTSYGPWFVLEIGLQMKKKYPEIIFCADFRDPSFNCRGILTKTFIFRNLTKKILEKADLITVVSKNMKESYSELLGSCGEKKVVFIPNGFDPEDYSNKILNEFNKNTSVYKIVYTGSLYPNTGEIKPFIKVLALLRKSKLSKDLCFTYCGKDYDEVLSSFKSFELEDILDNRGLVSREESLKIQSEADLLLLISYTGDDEKEGNGIITGKFYEYMASGKPVLVIGTKNWEMKEVIESDGVSRVFEKTQIKEMADYIQNLMNVGIKDRFYLDKRIKSIEQFSYSNIAKKLVENVEHLIDTT